MSLAGVSLGDGSVGPVGVGAPDLVGEDGDVDGVVVALITAGLDQQNLHLLILREA